MLSYAVPQLFQEGLWLRFLSAGTEAILHNQELYLLVLLHDLAVGAIPASNSQFAQQIRQPHILDGVEVAAGRAIPREQEMKVLPLPVAPRMMML